MKLTYELAKELKDAGFPQRSLDTTSLYWCTHRQTPDHKSVEVEPYLIYGSNGWVDSILTRAPSLSELIEACGAGFGLLHRKNETVWESCGGEYMGDYWSYQQQAPTPEVAVARLWLALNPKKI